MASEAGDSQTVLTRLEKLEAAIGRMKSIGIVMLALLGMVLLTGQTSQTRQVVEAERFVLVDADRHMRAELSMTESGPRLRFLDSQGQPILVLGMGPSMAGLGMFDASGKGRMLLGVATDGTPGLFLYSQETRLRAGLVAPPDQSASFGLFDGSGRGRARLTVEQDGTAHLIFFGTSGDMVFRVP